MDQQSPHPVNSRQWWDSSYFETQWDSHGGGDQTRYFMETLIASLPPGEQSYLQANVLTILDWGAFGEGVLELARAFPHSHVTGLDFSSRAVEQARLRHPQGEFIHSETGGIPRTFDAVVTSNCLEHFEFPLIVLERHLASCNSLYIVLVPYNEYPLSAYHRAQFRIESFPARIRGFVRLHAEPLDVAPRYWPGRQLLIVYGGDRYA